MKKILISMLVAVCLVSFSSVPAFADRWDRGKGKPAQWQKQKSHHKKPQKHLAANARKYHKNSREHAYCGDKKRPYHRSNREYRKYPRDRHRHSDCYVKKHSRRDRHGRYERTSVHIMLKFLDPGSGNRAFFSIGR